MSGIIGSAGSKSGVIGITELDYEEGSWTPTINTYSSGATGMEYTVNTVGTYTKIGNIVLFRGYLKLSNKGTMNTSGPDSAVAILQGFPFTMTDTVSNNSSGATITLYQNFTINFNSPVLTWYLTTAMNFRYIIAGSNSVYSNIVGSNFGNTTKFRFYGQYEV